MGSRFRSRLRLRCLAVRPLFHERSEMKQLGRTVPEPVRLMFHERREMKQRSRTVARGHQGVSGMRVVSRFNFAMPEIKAVFKAGLRQF